MCSTHVVHICVCYVCTCVHSTQLSVFQAFFTAAYIFNIYYIYVCILHCIHVIYIIYTVCTRYMYVVHVHVLHVLHTYTCGYTYHIHVYTVYTRTPTLSMHNNFTLKSVLFNFRLKYSASLFLLRRVLPQLFEEV